MPRFPYKPFDSSTKFGIDFAKWINNFVDSVGMDLKETDTNFNNAVETVSNKAFDKVVGAAKIEWLPPVNTFNDLETTYPDVVEGKTVMTRDSGKVYRFDGDNWIEIQDIDPSAINEVDNRLTAQLATNQLKMTSEEINVLFLPQPSSVPPAIADGVTDTTQSLNDIFSLYRGRKIFIPDGIYLISDSLIIFDDSTYELGRNAVIKFKEYEFTARNGVNDYSGRHIFKNHPTEGTKNIEIFGGCIDGSAPTQIRDAHRGFFLENVNNVKIHDIKIKEVSGWGIAHTNCNNFHFYNIELDQAPESKYGYNGDGITGASSNGLIENISGYTSDDLVSLNAGFPWFQKQSNVYNVTIRGVYPKPKIWVNDDGETVTEYCYRAFSLHVQSGFEMSNVLVEDVKGESVHELFMSSGGYTTTGIRGKFGSVTIRNVGVTFEGIETMGFQARYFEAENIKFENVSFFNMDGYPYQYTAFLFTDTLIKNLSLDGFYCNKKAGDNPFIVDTGEIGNIYFNNIYANNDAITTPQGYFYYKSSVKDNVTVINCGNIKGNVGSLVGKSSEGINKIRVASSNFAVRENFITNPTSGDMVNLIDRGMCVYNGSRFSLLSDVFNSPYIADGTKNYTLNSLCSILNIFPGVTTITITLGKNVEIGGYKFDLNVSSSSNVTLKDSNGNTLFNSKIFGTGTYSIARYGTSWMYAKISDSPYLFS